MITLIEALRFLCKMFEKKTKINMDYLILSHHPRTLRELRSNIYVDIEPFENLRNVFLEIDQPTGDKDLLRVARALYTYPDGIFEPLITCAIKNYALFVYVNSLIPEITLGEPMLQTPKQKVYIAHFRD